MKGQLRFGCWIVGWISLTNFAPGVRAQEPEPKAADTKLRVDLVDGSRIIGTTSNKSLTLNVDFAELTIPLDRIRQLQKGEKAKTVRVELNNGDIISGQLQAEPLNLTTIFGPVKLSMDQVLSVDVVPGNMIGWLPSQRGLVLYYPFDDGESATNHAADKHHGKSTGGKWLEKGLRDGSMEFDGQGAHHRGPSRRHLLARVYRGPLDLPNRGNDELPGRVRQDATGFVVSGLWAGAVFRGFQEPVFLRE